MVLAMKKALETSKIDDFEAFLYQLAIDLQDDLQLHRR